MRDKTLETVRQIYRDTESEAVRGCMESTLARLLKQQHERKQRQKDRELLICFRIFRHDYANHPSMFVRAKLETALPRVYRQLLERGVDVCTGD